MTSKTVSYVNIMDVFRAIGYAELAYLDSDIWDFFRWISCGDADPMFTLIGNNQCLQSIIEYLSWGNGQTFTDNQQKVLEEKFWAFVGKEDYINLGEW